MSLWYSIEVFDGASSASLWSEAYGDVLVGHALSSGATDWAWHEHSWGVVFEAAFEDERAWDLFHEQPAVLAALDAVPDPLTGIIMYRGRGGSSGASMRRPRRPLAGAGSAALPLPWDLGLDEITEVRALLADAAIRPVTTARRS
ncbi:MAG: hypothetical protein ACRDZY_22365 [Acidimicrobiales bacterium]